MKHFILQSLLTIGFAFAANAMFAGNSSAAEPADEPLAAAPLFSCAADEATPVALSVSGRSVRVANAQNCTLEVFDITGKCVCSVRIDSNDKTVALNLRKGWYILRVEKDEEKVIRKVLLP